MNGDALSRIADELVAIKRLIIFSMMRDGMGQKEIAEALGVSQPSISRMFGSGSAGARKSGKTSRSAIERATGAENA